jgi:hypothetical protein
MKRKRVSDSTQAEVLVKSRRRCCVCFGLSRDENVKPGQIAHLDQNPANGREENLAFLCFEHHDQYDSTTSQSKNLTRAEVERYREELYSYFSLWNRTATSQHLLNYLAASVDNENIARTLLKVGHEVTAFPDFQIQLALTENEIEFSDGDLAIPLLHVLDNLAAWGLLTFEFDEPGGVEEPFRFRIKHLNPEVAKEIAAAVRRLEPQPAKAAPGSVG